MIVLKYYLYYGGWIGCFHDEGCNKLQNDFCTVAFRVKVLPECNLPRKRSPCSFNSNFVEVVNGVILRIGSYVKMNPSVVNIDLTNRGLDHSLNLSI